MAMMTKRRLRAEIVRLTYRVAELEERLCPTEQHDWVIVGSRCEHIGCGEFQIQHPEVRCGDFGKATY